jgi:hypothetical protein
MIAAVHRSPRHAARPTGNIMSATSFAPRNPTSFLANVLSQQGHLSSGKPSALGMITQPSTPSTIASPSWR